MTPETPDRASRVADAVHEGRPVDKVDVRQGSSGRRILMILIVSAAAAAVLLFLIFGLNQPRLAATNANNGDQAVDAAAFDNDAVTPPAADAPTTPEGQPTNPPTGPAPNVNAPTVNPPAQ